MGSRLYDEFMKKLKVPPVRRFVTRKDASSEELVIAIPLKGGQGVPTLLSYSYSKPLN